MFAGHEHNFQHTLAADIHCFVTGGAGQNATEQPKVARFANAHVVSWSGDAHFLLVTVDGDLLTVRPIGQRLGEGLRDIRLTDPSGQAVTTPVRIPLSS